MAFESRLPAVIAALPKMVQDAVRAAAEEVAQSAKDRAPVETGKLRDAIHVEPAEGGDGAYVIAGDKTVFYGHMVEHGTTHSAPHPFLVPALEENRAQIEAEIAAAVRRAAQ